MVYLKRFTLPSRRDEEARINCHDYPFAIFPFRGIRNIEFSDITVLCGGNGSGKTTILNLIAESLHLPRTTLFNNSTMFDSYVSMCDYHITGGAYENTAPIGSAIYTSDDIFYNIIDRRIENEETGSKRRAAYDVYRNNLAKDRTGQLVEFKSLDSYDELAERIEVRRKTATKYMKKYGGEQITLDSNGQFALRFFETHLQENALYLLDEPENSLSPKYQSKLAEMLIESVRFFGCQLVIASHSPFFISLKGAVVYDLDNTPITQKAWWEIENMKMYFELFEKYRSKFISE